MDEFDDLLGQIDDGMAGKNMGLPMGFDRLNNHVGIRKANNYLVGGYTGTGKSAFVDDAFVLNPVDYYLNNPSTATPIEIIYWSMERPRRYKLFKWIAKKIFLDTGEVLPVERWMGWCIPEKRITPAQRDLFSSYREYYRAFTEIVHIMDGSENHNPTGMRNYMREFMTTQGRRWKEEGEHGKWHYEPNHPQKIIMTIKDHMSIVRKEKNLSQKKDIIDKVSEDDRYFRDFYGNSNIQINQFNREISNPTRLKAGDVEPILEDFKDSGSTQDDSDNVISLFDPTRYKVPDPSRYDLDKLTISGDLRYRSIKILKNSYGIANIKIGMGFLGAVGMFKELPKLDNITDNTYDNIRDGTFFLPHNH